MVQTLDVISVNLWQILISLANLVILFFLVKKFLYKPVKNLLAQRQAEIDSQYEKAGEAQRVADQNKAEWQTRLDSAHGEAEELIQHATEKASAHGERIVDEAKEKAAEIIRRAKSDAELELKKAREQIKEEIISVSTALTEKVLEREVGESDHRRLIDSFIEDIDDDGNE